MPIKLRKVDEASRRLLNNEGFLSRNWSITQPEYEEMGYFKVGDWWVKEGYNIGGVKTVKASRKYKIDTIIELIKEL